MTQEQITKINDLMIENSNCISFIKDYILRFRFADLASHTKKDESHVTGTGKTTTTENVVEQYEKDAEKTDWKADDTYACGVIFPFEFEDMLHD